MLNSPLVISDRRSIGQSDLIEVDKIQPNIVEQAYYVKYRSYHKWYFMSQQTTEDLALFTTWDSVRDTNNDVAGKLTLPNISNETSKLSNFQIGHLMEPLHISQGMVQSRERVWKSA